MSLLFFLACAGSPTLGEGSASLEHTRMAPMLDAHNQTRAFADPTPEPALADLVWSDELAHDALAWAQQCRSAHDPDLDGVGESWFAWSGAGEVDAWEVVVSWASESADYDYETNTCAGVCGHYTQIVWRDTTEVGCAFQACPDGLRGSFPEGREIWVCRYAPAGNVVGQSPY
ncbi:MAG: hypothetical protein EP330_08345 [Deltaproteobacteria bacterium]|nr:MAG: hypothetical protein EP330_08345 [Deltaproteobacteria bacterium]